MARLLIWCTCGLSLLGSSCGKEQSRVIGRGASTSATTSGSITSSADQTSSNGTTNSGSTTPSTHKLPERGMVVFGDSVARGMLVNTALGVAPPADITNDMYTDLTNYMAGKQPTLSDLELHYADINATAFVGDASYSHLTRLMQNSPTFSAKSYAISGARAASTRSMDFSAQVDQAVTDFSAVAAEQQPDYVVVEFGGNDWCSQTDPQAFMTAYQTQLTRVRNLFPEATILVIGVFDVAQLATAASASQVTLKLTVLGEAQQITCGQARASMCSRLNQVAATDIQDLVTMNQLLTQMVASINAAGGSAHPVILSSAAAQSAFITEDILAIDCFHPNLAGHERLADVSWNDLIQQL